MSVCSVEEQYDTNFVAAEVMGEMDAMAFHDDVGGIALQPSFDYNTKPRDQPRLRVLIGTAPFGGERRIDEKDE